MTKVLLAIDEVGVRPKTCVRKHSATSSSRPDYIDCGDSSFKLASGRRASSRLGLVRNQIRFRTEELTGSRLCSTGVQWQPHRAAVTTKAASRGGLQFLRCPALPVVNSHLVDIRRNTPTALAFSINLVIHRQIAFAPAQPQARSTSRIAENFV